MYDIMRTVSTSKYYYNGRRDATSGSSNDDTNYDKYSSVLLKTFPSSINQQISLSEYDLITCDDDHAEIIISVNENFPILPDKVRALLVLVSQRGTTLLCSE